MAALQSTTEGHPPLSRSFLDVLAGSTSANLHPRQPTTYRGFPSVAFSVEDINRFAAPFRFALIGKFSNGRPPMESIRKSFVSIGFAGSHTQGLIDHRHILINFQQEEDYARAFLKRIYSIDGFVMRLFKWSPEFSVESESAIVPIWINLPLLPLHLFHKEALHSIARLIGDPLKMDLSTSSLSRPSVARICVEIDLRKSRPDKVWIVNGNVGFWQPVEYENIPPLCAHCHKIGHHLEVCRSKDSPAVEAESTKQPLLPKVRLEYRPKCLQGQLRNSAAVIHADACVSNRPEAKIAAETGTDSSLAVPAIEEPAVQVVVACEQDADAAAAASYPCVPLLADKIMASFDSGKRLAAVGEMFLRSEMPELANSSFAMVQNATSASKSVAQPLDVAISPPSEAAATGPIPVNATSLTNCDLISLEPLPTHKEQPSSAPLSSAALPMAPSVAAASANFSVSAISLSSLAVLPPALPAEDSSALLVEQSAKPLSVEQSSLPSNDTAPSGVPVISSVADASHISPTNSPSSEIQDLIAVNAPTSSPPKLPQPQTPLLNAPPEFTIILGDPSLPASYYKQPTKPLFSRSDLEISLKKYEKLQNHFSNSVKTKLIPSASATAAHPSNALIATNVVDVAPLAAINPENALIPAPKAVDVAPLAVLPPEANPDDFSSELESEELLCYDDDLEIQSSYFQPLAPGRGRGKNKEFLQSDRVLRPRKKP